MIRIAPAHQNLVALRAPLANGALNSLSLPSRLKLLNWGLNASVKGPIRVTDLSAEALARQQKTRGFAEVAIDFEHNTVPGSPEYERTQEPRRVAAYGAPAVVPGEGLFLENIRWTPAGKESALQFIDISPAVELNSANEVTFVHSVALTRNGAVHGLSFFNAVGGAQLRGIERAIWAHSRQLKQLSAPPRNVILLSGGNSETGLARAIRAHLKSRDHQPKTL